MIEIEFEGKIVKPKSGHYKCPYKCGRPDYPQPKWKTESGFRQHMEKCTGKPSYKKAQAERNDERKKQFEAIQAEVLSNFEYKIGDVVCYVKELILKDTHEQRGTRMVRVRYEAVKKFEARQEEIKSIDFLDCHPLSVSTTQYVRDNSLRLNKHISLSSIRSNMDEATRSASEQQKSYDAHVEFSKSVR